MRRFRVPEAGFACRVNCDFRGSGVSASGMEYNAGRREAKFPLFCFSPFREKRKPRGKGALVLANLDANPQYK
jgi:hypothetical protein